MCHICLYTIQRRKPVGVLIFSHFRVAASLEIQYGGPLFTVHFRDVRLNISVGSTKVALFYFCVQCCGAELFYSAPAPDIFCQLRLQPYKLSSDRLWLQNTSFNKRHLKNLNVYKSPNNLDFVPKTEYTLKKIFSVSVR